MTPFNPSVMFGTLVVEEMHFTLVELSRLCHADVKEVVVLVDEGVLTPSSDENGKWLFCGSTLRRARRALRLTCELEMNPASAILVLDLIDEIEALRSQLRRRGNH